MIEWGENRSGSPIPMACLLIALAASLTLCQCGSEGVTPPRRAVAFDFASYLPEISLLDQWTPDRDPRLYEGEDLFAFINGGAEIYHEYGFERVIVQEYKKGPFQRWA